MRPSERPPVSVVLIDNGPLDLVSPVDQRVTIVPGPPLGDAVARSFVGTDDHLAIRPVALFDEMQLGPAGQLRAEVPEVWDPWDNWLFMRWGVLGYSQNEDASLPELTTVRSPLPQGLEALLVHGFDREFLFSRGVHPPVFLSVDAQSEGFPIPLTTDRSSYALVRRSALEGRLPDPSHVRTEDFLAALDYRLPPAGPERLAIRTAAGPSVFNPAAAGLLQIGVKAGKHRVRSLPRTHLVVALDVSAAMNWQGRLELVRQALVGLLPYLEASDRFSLVIFAEEAAEIVEEARAEDAPQLLSLLDRLDGSGGVNLVAGLQAAISAAIETETEAHLARRLVLITAAQPLLARQATENLQRMLQQAAEHDFQFDVVDVAHQLDMQRSWRELAGDVPGAVHVAHSAEQLRWALVATLTGDDSLVATEVELQVEFNPKAVAAYRVVGHEATGAGGLMPASVRADLHVDQEATALLEVWLYPNDEDDVATVSVSWTEPSGGTSRRIGPQRISRVQFATSFEGSPVSLQAAAIAAETAEILRQSFNFEVLSADRYRYQPKASDWGELLRVTRRASPQLAQRPDFRRLVELAERLNQLGAERRLGLARAGARGIIGGQWRELRE
jgi:Ca-activated chloride channel family protein